MENVLFYVEWSATILSLIFLALVMYEKIWCWFFGILSSILSVYLFYKLHLYSEAILYFFYILFGIYGWYTWNQPRKSLAISRWSWLRHIRIVSIGIILSLGIGYLFQRYTDADKSYIDAHTSVFGLVATYLEAHKILGAWIYWIIINGISVWLYYSKGLEVYTWLMLLYFILSFVGFYQWQKRLQVNSI